MRMYFLVAAVVGFLSTSAWAGPYPSFSDASARVTPDQVVGWASQVIDYSPSATIAAGADDPTAALGPPDAGLVSLGDLDTAQIAAGQSPGSITLRLASTAFNGPGADLAVFENAGTFFDDPFVFAELAFVEVSSDGTHFARFPAVSLNTESDGLITPFGRAFAGVDSTNINNLAGYHPQGFGTPFDLADLASNPAVVDGLVDLGAISFVRLVDIPGDGSVVDSLGNPILDAWLTAGSGGFDLDAVGVINAVPEPTAWLLLVAGAGLAAITRRPCRVGS